MLKHTPLYEAHRSAGAKLVDFAGWEMPLHYGSQLEEHHQVRRDAGMFDVSHMLAIDLHGHDALAFAQRLFANDAAKLTQPGAALYSCMLNENGGILDDLTVYKASPAHLTVVVNAAMADRDLGWLMLQKRVEDDVTIQARRDLAMIAVQGPHAGEKLRAAFPELRDSEALKPFSAAAIGDFFVARTGYTGEDGYELLLPAARALNTWQKLLQHGVKPAGLGARDTLRMEAGMNLYGQDMDESVSPYECGLAWTVALDQTREFIGKAALLRAGPTKRQRAGLLLLDKGVLRAHQQVITGAGDGVITSGGYSPTLNRSIAMARLPVAVNIGDTVKAMVRDHALAARVVKLPFVRNGKILIQEMQ